MLVCLKKTFYERFNKRVDWKDAKSKDPFYIERVMISHNETIKARRHVLNTLKELKISYDIADNPKMVEETGYSLIIVVGGDGTMLDYAQRISKVPVLGVNSSPSSSVGRFSYTGIDGLKDVLERIIAGVLKPVPLPRLKVVVEGKVLPYYALNEVLFSSKCPAETSRYQLTVGSSQRSSGPQGCGSQAVPAPQQQSILLEERSSFLRTMFCSM